ncbi:hypothetical protein CEXT_479201 [Caerostris extrusa]|uniref:Uncharacterized protein n=1 Tax=Caerostris extrusa TaxID=172846 RepID=A0AAV4R5D6_CAEEX|nr:hypothetical protein CEXT_479201 [Caerostris extrusa]
MQNQFCVDHLSAASELLCSQSGSGLVMTPAGEVLTHPLRAQRHIRPSAYCAILSGHQQQFFLVTDLITQQPVNFHFPPLVSMLTSAVNVMVRLTVCNSAICAHEQRSRTLMKDNTASGPVIARPQFNENNTPLRFHSLVTLISGESLALKNQPCYRGIIISLA